jgi:adenosylcobinamide-GDP ribazoletransferase
MIEIAMNLSIRPSRLAADVVTAVLFCTRLPVGKVLSPSGSDIARASWAFPIAGAVVGVIAAATYWLTRHLGVPPLVAAGLTLAVTLGVTGCLHEDGLADVADSFGGQTRERKLEIMRDSRIGVFGGCALALSLLLRCAALAAISDPMLAAPVLVAAHMAARAPLSAFMMLVPPARPNGLSAGAGRPHAVRAIVGSILGLLALTWALGPAAGLAALALLVAAFALLAWWSVREIGGQTGDVLGALEQFGEIAVLVVAASIRSLGG